MAEVIDQALDDLTHRRVILLYLAAYLSRCVAGSIPDPEFWLPPFL